MQQEYCNTAANQAYRTHALQETIHHGDLPFQQQDAGTINKGQLAECASSAFQQPNMHAHRCMYIYSSTTSYAQPDATPRSASALCKSPRPLSCLLVMGFLVCQVLLRNAAHQRIICEYMRKMSGRSESTSAACQ